MGGGGTKTQNPRGHQRPGHHLRCHGSQVNHFRPPGDAIHPSQKMCETLRPWKRSDVHMVEMPTRYAERFEGRLSVHLDLRVLARNARSSPTLYHLTNNQINLSMTILTEARKPR